VKRQGEGQQIGLHPLSKVENLNQSVSASAWTRVCVLTLRHECA
jgi:hypothetical protein